MSSISFCISIWFFQHLDQS